MCELFGVSSPHSVRVNDYLKTFFSHSVNHRNGWGVALFCGPSVSLEKEPVQAGKSAYLAARLRHPLEVTDMIAHIRFATRGADEYANTHPFVKRDECGRFWTFAHNGTVFDYPRLDPYFKVQEGRTDSERVLCYLVDRVNGLQREYARPLDASERFALLNEIVCDMAQGNKLNFLLYDGEYLYVHTNYAGSLHYLNREGAVLFSTLPLGQEGWQPVPFATLLSYRGGRLVKRGTPHGKEYRDNEKDSKLIFLDYSSL